MNSPFERLNRRKFIRQSASAIGAGTLASTVVPFTAIVSASTMAQKTAGNTMPNDICFSSARQLAAQIAARKVSAREVMQAHLARISRVNPRLNAIVAKLDDDKCLALADAADQRLARKEKIGPLHGQIGRAHV